MTRMTSEMAWRYLKACEVFGRRYLTYIHGVDVTVLGARVEGRSRARACLARPFHRACTRLADGAHGGVLVYTQGYGCRVSGMAGGSEGRRS